MSALPPDGVTLERVSEKATAFAGNPLGLCCQTDPAERRSLGSSGSSHLLSIPRHLDSSNSNDKRPVGKTLQRPDRDCGHCQSCLCFSDPKESNSAVIA